jgi:hypothetical protein
MIECNSIPWASGYTGLVHRNSSGFESSASNGRFILSLSLYQNDMSKILIFFIRVFFTSTKYA